MITKRPNICACLVGFIASIVVSSGSRPARAQEAAIPPAAVAATRGVVQILLPADGDAKGLGGTGFVFGDGNHIVTFSSAMGDYPYPLGTPFRVRADENRILDAKLVWRGAPLRDWTKQPIQFAVLRIIQPANQSANPLQPFSLRVASLENKSRQGDRVFVVGYRSEAQATSQLTGKAQIYAGINNADFIDVPSEIQFFQTNVGIENGFQGGPVVDSNGAVVGLAYHRGTRPIEIRSLSSLGVIGEARMPGVNYILSVYELLRYEKALREAGVDTAGWAWSAPVAPMRLSPWEKCQDFAASHKMLLVIISSGIVIMGALTLMLVIFRGNQEENDGKMAAEALVSPHPSPLLLPVPPTAAAPLATSRAAVPLPSVPVAQSSLHGITGGFAGKTLPLGERFVVIGRDPKECQIVFPPETDGISRSHCGIRFNAQERVFILKDLGSNFGTFLADGKRLAPNTETRLGNGGRFYVASPSHTFEARLS